MKSHQEQVIADLFRALFKMGMLDIYKLDKMIDELQIRLFRREIKSRFHP